jgi:hypothetical protein
MSLSLRRFFKKEKQERRILRQIERTGDQLQPEYHRPTPECPLPERWRMFDSMTAEAEVLEFLRTVVTTIKPELVVETGTFSGISTLWIAEGLKANGRGRVITCEFDYEIYKNAKARIQSSGLAEWIELRNESRQRYAHPRAGNSPLSAADQSLWPDPDARRQFAFEDRPRSRTQTRARRPGLGRALAHPSRLGGGAKARREKIGSGRRVVSGYR